MGGGVSGSCCFFAFFTFLTVFYLYAEAHQIPIGQKSLGLAVLSGISVHFWLSMMLLDCFSTISNPRRRLNDFKSIKYRLNAKYRIRFLKVSEQESINLRHYVLPSDLTLFWVDSCLYHSRKAQRMREKPTDAPDPSQT